MIAIHISQIYQRFALIIFPFKPHEIAMTSGHPEQCPSPQRLGRLQKALTKILPHLETAIVKRSDQTKGFVVLPRHWVVERTIPWLNRCRRLAKDWENLNRKALAFLRLASISLIH